MEDDLRCLNEGEMKGTIAAYVRMPGSTTAHVERFASVHDAQAYAGVMRRYVLAAGRWWVLLPCGCCMRPVGDAS